MDDLPMHPLRAMFDGLGAAWQKQRAETQMTLGKLIAALEALPADATVEGFGQPMSYRGYYDDLAFDTAWRPRTVGELLAAARACMGKVFIGYKGGEFVMGERTPVWIAPYGSTGKRLMGLTDAEPYQPVTAPDDSL